MWSLLKMKLPNMFIPEKNLDKKIEEFLTKEILNYNPEEGRNKAFVISVVYYGEEFNVEYPLDVDSKGFIGKELRVTQQRIENHGLKDLLSLAECISEYHNGSATLCAAIKSKDGRKEGGCNIYLKNLLSVEDISKSVRKVYYENMDKVKSFDIKCLESGFSKNATFLNRKK